MHNNMTCESLRLLLTDELLKTKLSWWMRFSIFVNETDDRFQSSFDLQPNCPAKVGSAKLNCASDFFHNTILLRVSLHHLPY